MLFRNLAFNTGVYTLALPGVGQWGTSPSTSNNLFFQLMLEL